jgi:hypothetical protein
MEVKGLNLSTVWLAVRNILAILPSPSTVDEIAVIHQPKKLRDKGFASRQHQHCFIATAVNRLFGHVHAGDFPIRIELSRRLFQVPASMPMLLYSL